MFRDLCCAEPVGDFHLDDLLNFIQLVSRQKLLHYQAFLSFAVPFTEVLKLFNLKRKV